MTLSLCMIVKNEEQVLARCLESVRGCFDEMIILDTGSDDQTCEIARRYTDRIYHVAWENDFSKARNQAFSYATCDYIMWLDADDILSDENREKLLQLKRELCGDIDLYYMIYATAFDEMGEPTFYYIRERIVKRTAPHQWNGCVHEILQCDGHAAYTEIRIDHKSIKTTYSDRNLKIFEQKIKAVGSLSPRDRFYYARELFYHKRFWDAKKQLTAFLSSGEGWIENRIDAYYLLSKCHDSMEDTEGALQYLMLSMTEAPPRAQTACEIGRLLMKQERFRDAIWWHLAALQHCDTPTNGAFVNTDYHEYIPCLQLCVCYDKIGEKKLAFEYHKRVQKIRPMSPAVLYNEQYFASFEP